VSGIPSLVVAETRSPVTVVAGVALFGIGFAITQNATLPMMYSRVTSSGCGAVGGLWNFAYDAGMGVGARRGSGCSPGGPGTPGRSSACALMAVALVPAWRDQLADGAAR
jgi:hypothetical protein